MSESHVMVFVNEITLTLGLRDHLSSASTSTVCNSAVGADCTP